VFIDIDTADPVQYLENKHRLERYLVFLTSAYPGISFKGAVIDGKDFENAIELYHVQHETDMAALITYPKGFWEKIFHKSVTRKMAFHSTIPVLAIPFHEKE
jgi:nucleotide-binding universal stress UspA family protein